MSPSACKLEVAFELFREGETEEGCFCASCAMSTSWRVTLSVRTLIIEIISDCHDFVPARDVRALVVRTVNGVDTVLDDGVAGTLGDIEVVELVEELDEVATAPALAGAELDCVPIEGCAPLTAAELVFADTLSSLLERRRLGWRSPSLSSSLL